MIGSAVNTVCLLKVSIPQAVSAVATLLKEGEVVVSDRTVSIPQAVSAVATRYYAVGYMELS